MRPGSPNRPRRLRRRRHASSETMLSVSSFDGPGLRQQSSAPDDVNIEPKVCAIIEKFRCGCRWTGPHFDGQTWLVQTI
jgi:hypothetical protein